MDASESIISVQYLRYAFLCQLFYSEFWDIWKKMTVLDISSVDSRIAMHIPWNCKEVVWGSEQQANLVEILQHVCVSAKMELMETHISICTIAGSKLSSELHSVLTQMEVMFQEAFVL